MNAININDLNLEQLSEKILREEGHEYPSSLYAKLQNAPGYEASKESFPILMRIQKAHFVMLAQEELLSKEDIAAIKAALGNVPYEEFYNSAYDKHHEDMYYTLEAWMMKQYGDGCGNLHIGRSRNDIGSATVRIQVREQLLVMLDTLHRLHHAVIAFSKEHRDLIMGAHTHTQQAQIGTLGHTMIAFAKVLERCIKRLQRAYDGNNLSPMGAAAIETSGFAVNRDTVCRLLGFDGLVENSYDCIAGGDHFSETACAVEITALEIGRMVANSCCGTPRNLT